MNQFFVSGRIRALSAVFVCLASASCALSPSRPKGFTDPDTIDVPRLEVFARDRPANAGFATPEQAAAAFMRALFAAKHDLLRDDAFKRRILAVELRARIAISLEQFKRSPVTSHPEDFHPARPDPFNKTIFNAWDIPTSFTMGSGHRTGEQAVVDAIYHWGPGTQYQGDRRIVSVILRHEKGRWFVDDLYNHDAEFTTSSLCSSLVR